MTTATVIDLPLVVVDRMTLSGPVGRIRARGVPGFSSGIRTEVVVDTVERDLALRHPQVPKSARHRALAAKDEMLVARSKKERRHIASGLLSLINTGTTGHRCRNAGAL